MVSVSLSSVSRRSPVSARVSVQDKEAFRDQTSLFFFYQHLGNIGPARLSMCLDGNLSQCAKINLCLSYPFSDPRGTPYALSSPGGSHLFSFLHLW